MQIKSFDMRIFFLPYFLNPKPAGILAANLREDEYKSSFNQRKIVS